ncbi:hypothetical protein [Corallococcus macrosporus]|uniref:Uncharacterized protein n=1 Tax=Myxococcus fulvus (strain ATCC BAA-855 / HW-1) TaxID=483219 RepID=F8CPW4_MYXFH|nr:hypothetical protein [Corallococcus macrosporus]AEI62987.1 hypothetical protein LILAB_05330 [Corallococcus macrosporus]
METPFSRFFTRKVTLPGWSDTVSRLRSFTQCQPVPTVMSCATKGLPLMDTKNEFSQPAGGGEEGRCVGSAGMAVDVVPGRSVHPNVPPASTLAAGVHWHAQPLVETALPTSFSNAVRSLPEKRRPALVNGASCAARMRPLPSVLPMTSHAWQPMSTASRWLPVKVLSRMQMSRERYGGDAVTAER